MAHPKQQVHPEDLERPEAKDWLASHQDTGLKDLRLKFGLKRPYASWIAQLEVQRKYANKFPSLLLANWIFPTGQATEQSSSERTALYKASLISSQFTVDLCAGMGIDSWAFTQRDGSFGHFANELDPGLSKLLKFNLKNTTHTAGTATSVLPELKCWLHEKDVSPAEVTIYLDPDRRTGNGKSVALRDASPNVVTLQHELFKLGHTVLPELKCWLHEKDVSPSEVTIYLDPDRRTGNGKSVALRDASPNVVTLQHELFKLGHTLMTKHSPMVDLNVLYELEHLSEIHIVEYQGECKEVLAIQHEGYIGPPAIKAVLLQENGSIERISSNKAIALSFVNELDEYLIQPGPALAKSRLHEEVAIEQLWKKWTVGNLYTTD